MRRRVGNLLIIMGGICILCAVYMVAIHYYHEYQAGKYIDTILPELESKIGDVTVNSTDEKNAPQDSAVMIDGNLYIGILKVPSLELELPILKDYSYDHLNISPCLYSGSYETDNMVLAGHNYRRHFSLLRNISEGTEISFLAVSGKIYQYRVLRVEILEPTQVEYLIDNENDEWDLSLFTCTLSGATRCVVRCVRET
ncbi:MAG: sortase [Lachnospiraceae bacterium]|nr:sortase [Lachnospiraceae bacterium]